MTNRPREPDGVFAGSIFMTLSRPQMRKHTGSYYAEAKEHSSGGEQYHYSSSQEIDPPGTDEVAHDFTVIDQHVKKYQCGRHGQHGNRVDDESHIDQREARYQRHRAGDSGAEQQHGVKALAFGDRKIQTVRPLCDFAESIRRRYRDGNQSDHAGFEYAQSKQRRPEPSNCGLQRSEEHTSELQSQFHLVCRLLLEKKKNQLSNSKCIVQKKLKSL